jgi:hypothetical protein
MLDRTPDDIRRARALLRHKAQGNRNRRLRQMCASDGRSERPQG